MMKAIIFDCFGVLVSDNWRPFKKKYFGAHPAVSEEVSQLGRRLNSGTISYEAFIREVAQKAGISPAQAAQEIDGNVVNEELFAYIAEELKPKYEIGLLSNVGDNWLRGLFSDEQLALFDAVVLSYQAGSLKPEAEAYLMTARELQVAAEECVLIDDKERHCEGARRTGMGAILYEDFDQAKQALEKLLAADTEG